MEFSELVRDVLSRREGVDLFLSPEGRDRGIDILRSGVGDPPEIVVQCKRYIKSQKSKLLADLRAELSKVQLINPRRYVIAASQSLNIDNKVDLRHHFEPYIKTTDDILGTEDINDLLARHRDVEYKHYKLWLRSSEVLRVLLNEGTGVWHDQIRAEIDDNSKFYVQTPAFHKALSILESSRIVVLAGTAGIGKTTLAQMLAAHHIHGGFQFFEIESLEVEPKYIPRDVPVFIYFDDFLGRSVWLDNANPVTEKRLERLIDLVERDSRLRLVLTTRTYLLESARKFSDVGDRKLIVQPQVVVELADYSKTTRAKILYNHLYFREARPSNCKSLTDLNLLNKILSHRNFSPRVIDWVCREEKDLDSESTNFAMYLLACLDNPERLYKSVIQERISENARDILFCLLSQRTRQEVTVDRLKVVVNCFRFCESRPSLENREFQSGLRELDGSLTVLRRSYYFKGQEIVAFLNPGVEDSAKSSLWESNLKWLTLVESADCGEDLYALILCAKGISSNPYDDQIADVPKQWFDRWLVLSSLHQGRADELLDALVKCLRLNIWNRKFDVVRELIFRLRQRHDEGYDYWPTWSILGTNVLPFEAVSTLDSIEDFGSDFQESVKEELINLDLFEASDRFGYIKHMGMFGFKGYEVLEEAVIKRCDELWRGAWEESDGLYMREADHEELKKLVELYELQGRFLALDEVSLVYEQKVKAQQLQVATPTASEEEEPDSVILAMFESLAIESNRAGRSRLP